MTYVIGSPCEGVCDVSCVDACPVDCIYAPIPIEEIKRIREEAGAAEDEKLNALAGFQLYIHPDECIDCDACLPQCPVDAIRPDTEDHEVFDVSHYAQINEQYFESGNPAYNSIGKRED